MILVHGRILILENLGVQFRSMAKDITSVTKDFGDTVQVLVLLNQVCNI